MIRRYPLVILSLLMLCGPLGGQPEFSWPVDMAGVDTLNGNLGEPRPDEEDQIQPLTYKEESHDRI